MKSRLVLIECHAVGDVRAMTRCECAEISFAALATRAEREGIDEIELLCRRTGCACTCTACLPDLIAYLDARRRTRQDTPVGGAA